MHFASLIVAFAGSLASVSALAIRGDVASSSDGYTQVQPGGIEDLTISYETTLNGTYKGDEPIVVDPVEPEAKATPTLNMRFLNRFGGFINAYITGLDPSGRVVFIRGDGSLYYPSSGGSGVPIWISQADVQIPMNPGQELNIVLPFSVTSGRIYYAAGDLSFAVVATDVGEGIVQPAPNNIRDPSANINWGFVELTLTSEGVLYANISYVDFVGLPLGMELTVNGGPTQSAYGVTANAVASICNSLGAQTGRDGRPWGGMCLAGSNGPVRVLSPYLYTDLDANGFVTYWDQYANDVWNKYRSQPLVIDTQGPAGRVNCWVTGDVMNCDGDNRGYARPTARDIWGCDSGPFGKASGDNGVHLAVIPRLCAAFVRSTLLLGGGEVQPGLGQTSYYLADPSNHYSRIVHEHEVDGKGYAFAYDDVNPGSENASGTVSAANSNTLTIFIGSPP
ncbi:glycoside hydrolase family 64 protein [Stachybotrys elegans]|uniref:Glycoside hydrolase family 64 protein n=1 Tax=Stachybotrys elegans TaxID=80388 RepID=A0A8K0SRH9_9HYPO|nr:glycoside hydrolase family 64 protein [Stachybotrys elegans]